MPPLERVVPEVSTARSVERALPPARDSVRVFLMLVATVFCRMSASASFMASKPACSACLRADTFGLTGFDFATFGAGLTTLGGTAFLTAGAGCLTWGFGSCAFGAGSGFGVCFTSKISVAMRGAGSSSGFFSNSGNGRYGMMTPKTTNSARQVFTIRRKRASASAENSHGISIAWLHVDITLSLPRAISAVLPAKCVQSRPRYNWS